MNLEPIDTSTTAGKARVMQLAAEGRKVAFQRGRDGKWSGPLREELDELTWNWSIHDYAIIAEPVGPEGIWCVIGADGKSVVGLYQDGTNPPAGVIRYIRADLAGRDE